MTPIDLELQKLENLANRMDAAFRIPGTGIRVGADSIIGLVPGIGDGLALAPAGWIMWKARELGAPSHLLTRMGANVAIDAVIGSIPLIGDLFDVGWKANLRNVKLLREHMERKMQTASPVMDEAA
ncbi:DUF4112 domain-containing protein [Pelagovum pacificum]|uniref:DUF4112 domain-containing protein n=1 Tax=Pelagovum pacificum TaxID=2588711 RepID=A0A5C5GCV2_9RHOB|nr:DUF4112 domain-containing protein [Pelagovum pacificum]QQA41380.1 DUF4112 domain-containing protein [Pelagovum pacificum]TNY31817.1 DUF4112 domain-containing protein [Pelagovum pacificum]